MDKNYQSRLDAIDKLIDLLKEFKLEVTYNEEVLFLGSADEEVAFFDKAKQIISESSDYQMRIGRLTEQVLFTEYYSAAVDKYVQMNEVITYEGSTVDSEHLLKLRKEVENNLHEHLADNEHVSIVRDELKGIELAFATPDIEYDTKIEIRDIIRNSQYFKIMSPIDGHQKVYDYFYNMLKHNLYQDMKELDTENNILSEHTLSLQEDSTSQVDSIDANKLSELRSDVEQDIFKFLDYYKGYFGISQDENGIPVMNIEQSNLHHFNMAMYEIIQPSSYYKIQEPIEGRKEVYDYFKQVAAKYIYEQTTLVEVEPASTLVETELSQNNVFIDIQQHGLLGYGVDHEDNRIYIKTDGKPSQEIRNMIKTAGMRWTPSKSRWQRQLTSNAITSLKSNLFDPLDIPMDVDSLELETLLKTTENDVNETIVIEPNSQSQDLNDSLTKIELQRTIYENENTKLLNLMKSTNWAGMEKQIESQQTIVSQELRRLMNLTSDHSRNFANVEVSQPTNATKDLNDLQTQPKSELANTLSGNAKDIDMSDVFEELKVGVKNAFENPVEFKSILDFASTSQNYSLNNILLLQSQIDRDVFMSNNPVITNTYNGWKQQGITVNKGEKALKIIKPGTFKAFKNEQGIIKSVNNATDHEKQLIESGKIDVFEKNYFRLKAEVFLYTQTDADISKLFADRIVEHPDAGKLYEQIKEQTQAHGVQVLERNIGLPAGKAVEHGNSKLIIINDQLNDAHKLKTLIHEIAHIETHFDNNDSTLNTKELEAEASAYLTCKELGIDTSNYSFSYLASWSKDKEVKELTQAFSSIKQITLNIKEKYIIKNDAINHAQALKEHDTGFKQTAIKDASQHMSIDM